MHTGEKPFECDICRQRYSTKSNLTVHRKKHSNETDFHKKEHKCPYCNKLHASKKTLAKHVKRQVSSRFRNGLYRAFEFPARQELRMLAGAGAAPPPLPVLRASDHGERQVSASAPARFASAVERGLLVLRRAPRSVLQKFTVVPCSVSGFGEDVFKAARS